MKRKFLFSVALFLIVCALQYYFLRDQNFHSSVLSDIVTFLSILFGFYITSLAIFVTSQYVSSLYMVTDKEQKDQTLLHTLTKNYQFGLVLTLVSLIYFIGVQFTPSFLPETQLTLNSAVFFPIIPLLALDFIYCYLMLKDLINIIIQEGKNRSSKVPS